VIRRERAAACPCDRTVAMLSNASTADRRPAPGSLGRTTFRRPTSTGVTSMMRQTTLSDPQPTEVEERSMRLVEWALALVAMVTAGILAFVR